jgi:site-specific recombinase XerD
VLSAEETRKLLDSIESDTLIGLRDRALIGIMVYIFAVGAMMMMKVGDFLSALQALVAALAQESRQASHGALP